MTEGLRDRVLEFYPGDVSYCEGVLSWSKWMAQSLVAVQEIDLVRDCPRKEMRALNRALVVEWRSRMDVLFKRSNHPKGAPKLGYKRYTGHQGIWSVFTNPVKSVPDLNNPGRLHQALCRSLRPVRSPQLPCFRTLPALPFLLQDLEEHGSLSPS